MDVTSRFADAPLVTVSGRFPLCRPHSAPVESTGGRPWGLRDLVPAHDDPPPPWRYDGERQLLVIDDGTGRAVVACADSDPTAPTTSRTDGEDPPSSEDWKNDYHHDEPCPY